MTGHDLSKVRDPDAAFVAWAKKYTRGRPPGAPDSEVAA